MNAAAVTSSRRRDRELIRRARGYVAAELLRAGDCLLTWPLPVDIGRAVMTYALVGGVYDVPPTVAVHSVDTAEMTGAWPHVDYATGNGLLHRDDLLAETLSPDEPPPEALDMLRLWGWRSTR